jgi:hypothetical protein
MKPHDPEEQFIHLVRLGWDLRDLGVCTSLVLPVIGEPVLEIMSAGRSRVRIAAARHGGEWVFTWRPWWARWWRRGEQIWVGADNAADMILSAVAA